MTDPLHNFFVISDIYTCAALLIITITDVTNRMEYFINFSCFGQTPTIRPKSWLSLRCWSSITLWSMMVQTATMLWHRPITINIQYTETKSQVNFDPMIFYQFCTYICVMGIPHVYWTSSHNFKWMGTSIIDSTSLVPHVNIFPQFTKSNVTLVKRLIYNSNAARQVNGMKKLKVHFHQGVFHFFRRRKH